MISIGKIEGLSEVATATPAEVAEVVFSTNDTNQFSDDEQEKLVGCRQIKVITQAEYDAIPTKETEVIYMIMPEV